MQELRERGGARQVAAECIRNELPHVFACERRKRNVLHVRSRVPKCFKLARQWMRRRDFVVPVRADQHQVRHAGWSQQIFEEIERRRIEPLQVVEEQCQWMLRAGKDADKPPKHQLEAPLRVVWWKLRDRWLVADDELQLRDQVHHGREEGLNVNAKRRLRHPDRNRPCEETSIPRFRSSPG